MQSDYNNNSIIIYGTKYETQFFSIYLLVSLQFVLNHLN